MLYCEYKKFNYRAWHLAQDVEVGTYFIFFIYPSKQINIQKINKIRVKKVKFLENSSREDLSVFSTEYYQIILVKM